jgi:hypothetical protein
VGRKCGTHGKKKKKWVEEIGGKSEKEKDTIWKNQA